MGSSDSGGGVSGLAEGSVGSIVWVRRRNGSWWPGKILGPDELSATHLMSPRSGTPVKLLGREDASVDWYNLEKSKRVKSFRCGEFSDCIEKAEAAQGLPAKKREKYARREDAILHALELEKELVEKKYGKIVCNTAKMLNGSSDCPIKELATSSGTLCNSNLKLGNHYLHKSCLNGGSYAENQCDSSPLCADRAKRGAWISSELESLEMKAQRTGLPPYGVRTTPSKGSTVSSAALDISNSSKAIAAIGDHDYPISTTRACLQSYADTNLSNTMEEKDFLLERVPGEPSVKGHKKHHPPLQELNSEKLAGHSWRPDDDIVSTTGLENTRRVKRSRTACFPTGSGAFMNSGEEPNTDLEVPISQLGVVNEQSHSGAFVDEISAGSSEDTETDHSDSNFMIPVMDAEMAAYSDVFTPREGHSAVLNRLDIMAEHESTSSEESDALSLDDHSDFHLRDPISASTGVSRWQLKGKRNVRSLKRRSMDGSAPGIYLHGDGRFLNRSRSPSLRYYQNDEDYANEVDFIDDDCRPLTDRFGEMKAASKHQTGQNLIDWDQLTLGDRSMSGFSGERAGNYNPVYGGRSRHGMLIDVHVQVQAKHRGEHAPWVSLMSKLNGKAITGHPIQVEKLDDGSTDVLLPTSGNFRYDNDDNRVPPAWRTARRTSNSRVPRPQLPSRLDGYEAGRYSHARKPGPGSSGGKKGLAKRSIPYTDRQQPQRMKKPLKKESLSSSQRTRTLSSMGIDQRQGHRSRHHSENYDIDGVIKPLISGPTTVSCIPVKLVFSRLLEVIGRPPAYHGVSVNQQ